MSTPQEDRPGPALRLRVGVILFALAGLLVLSGVVMLFTGKPETMRSGWVIWVLAGPPEILCLLAAGILGKENYQMLAKKVRRGLRQPAASAQAASRLRYYTGLAGCLFNGVPLTLYAYVPELLPGGPAKMSILVVADVIFLGSVFFAGGEFWEKLRSLFIWDGDQAVPGPSQ